MQLSLLSLQLILSLSILPTTYALPQAIHTQAADPIPATAHPSPWNAPAGQENGAIPDDKRSWKHLPSPKTQTASVSTSFVHETWTPEPNLKENNLHSSPYYKDSARSEARRKRYLPLETYTPGSRVSHHTTGFLNPAYSTGNRNQLSEHEANTLPESYTPDAPPFRELAKRGRERHPNVRDDRVIHAFKSRGFIGKRADTNGKGKERISHGQSGSGSSVVYAPPGTPHTSANSVADTLPAPDANHPAYGSTEYLRHQRGRHAPVSIPGHLPPEHQHQNNDPFQPEADTGGPSMPLGGHERLRHQPLSIPGRPPSAPPEQYLQSTDKFYHGADMHDPPGLSMPFQGHQRDRHEPVSISRSPPNQPSRPGADTDNLPGPVGPILGHQRGRHAPVSIQERVPSTPMQHSDTDPNAQPPRGQTRSSTAAASTPSQRHRGLGFTMPEDDFIPPSDTGRTTFLPAGQWRDEFPPPIGPDGRIYFGSFGDGGPSTPGYRSRTPGQGDGHSPAVPQANPQAPPPLPPQPSPRPSPRPRLTIVPAVSHVPPRPVTSSPPRPASQKRSDPTFLGQRGEGMTSHNPTRLERGSRPATPGEQPAPGQGDPHSPNQDPAAVRTPDKPISLPTGLSRKHTANGPRERPAHLPKEEMQNPAEFHLPGTPGGDLRRQSMDHRARERTPKLMSEIAAQRPQELPHATQTNNFLAPQSTLVYLGPDPKPAAQNPKLPPPGPAPTLRPPGSLLWETPDARLREMWADYRAGAANHQPVPPPTPPASPPSQRHSARRRWAPRPSARKIHKRGTRPLPPGTDGKGAPPVLPFDRTSIPPPYIGRPLMPDEIGTGTPPLPPNDLPQLPVPTPPRRPIGLMNSNQPPPYQAQGTQIPQDPRNRGNGLTDQPNIRQRWPPQKPRILLNPKTAPAPFPFPHSAPHPPRPNPTTDQGNPPPTYERRQVTRTTWTPVLPPIPEQVLYTPRPHTTPATISQANPFTFPQASKAPYKPTLPRIDEGAPPDLPIPYTTSQAATVATGGVLRSSQPHLKLILPTSIHNPSILPSNSPSAVQPDPSAFHTLPPFDFRKIVREHHNNPHEDPPFDRHALYDPSSPKAGKRSAPEAATPYAPASPASDTSDDVFHSFSASDTSYDVHTPPEHSTPEDSPPPAYSPEHSPLPAPSPHPQSHSPAQHQPQHPFNPFNQNGEGRSRHYGQESPNEDLANEVTREHNAKNRKKKENKDSSKRKQKYEQQKAKQQNNKRGRRRPAWSVKASAGEGGVDACPRLSYRKGREAMARRWAPPRPSPPSPPSPPPPPPPPSPASPHKE